MAKHVHNDALDELAEAGSPESAEAAETTEEMLDRLDRLAESLEDPTEGFEIQALTGDVASTIIGWFRANKKPYEMMSFAEQNMLIHSANKLATDIVKRATRIIAEDDRPTIQAKVESVTFKGGIKAVLTLSRSSEYRHDLADAEGMEVIIVVTDAARYEGEREPLLPDAPQSGQHDLLEKSVFDQTTQGADHAEHTGLSVDELLPEA